MMSGHGKSDNSIVPRKSSNKVRQKAAEQMEGRGLAEGNCLGKTRSGHSAGGTCPVRLSGYVKRRNSLFSRYHPKQEPYEVIPQVRICAGGAGQPAFLPRPIFFICHKERSVSSFCLLYGGPPLATSRDFSELPLNLNLSSLPHPLSP
jgi:hypothetical protein